jgi:hypothetical protein
MNPIVKITKKNNKIQNPDCAMLYIETAAGKRSNTSKSKTKNKIPTK